MVSTIWNVIWPFEYSVVKRNINVYLIQDFNFGSQSLMESDWMLYEQVLYNVLQNSFKYNQANYGDVIIV